MTATDVSLDLTTTQDTNKLATVLADLARPGLAVLLEGPVGAGKSYLARTVILTLLARDDHTEDVPSPTFTLVQTYQARNLEIWHADLYRLTSTEDLVELGLDAAFETAFCLIEWPDRLGELLPDMAIRISLDHGAGDTHRTCRISACGSDMQNIVEDIRNRMAHA
ncbi:MAG: tRNA (adenosine(37)-N6)-threonylcarbamoyltransferase complex ATPase subunit type 1 TsaE [Litoreibacter sp.]|nr:tRNA (adenosine(37)-N6)-threonylcarbamoyltransferase complex ATPase subunit type 1 TsaE [Litoreibacter sp.]